ncbi:MAG: hypothetical protein KF752_09340 [Pirellulaceae bacterium]|nr:hypothetical protein [Pirellulaceae bacterium]
MQNPFAGVGKFDERADRRRERRAMTRQELRQMLHVGDRLPIMVERLKDCRLMNCRLRPREAELGGQ